jgi:hypothetical protein
MTSALVDWRLSLAALVAASSLGCAVNRAAPAADGPAALTPLGPGGIISARDEEGAPVTLRVESVEKDANDADGDVFLYQLSIRNPAGGWQPYCFPDPQGRTVAIPLQGSWDASRTHVENEEITFACTNGALGKCVRWGYKPWKTFHGVSLAPYHQACVHMTGADYCGNGQAHTRDGTLIDLYDNLGIQKRDASLALPFEAAWSPSGAVYLSKPRYGETIESIVSSCPGRLQGHTAVEAPHLDEQAIQQRWPEALIFNESRVLTEKP